LKVRQNKIIFRIYTTNWSFKQNGMPRVNALALVFPCCKHSYNCVPVVDNLFSNMPIFPPCKKSIIVKFITKHSFYCVLVIFLLPHIIISISDNQFLNILWSNKWSLIDINMTKLTIFNPKTNGYVYVLKRMVVYIFHVHKSSNQHRWD